MSGDGSSSTFLAAEPATTTAALAHPRFFSLVDRTPLATADPRFFSGVVNRSAQGGRD
jgi:hypothetical protein